MSRAEVSAQAGRLPAGGTGLQVSPRVDPKSLSFQKDHGKHLDKLNLITALFTTDGKFVTGELGVVDMALSSKSPDALNQRSLNATVVLQDAEGKYRLRVVMEDAASGKLFATSRLAQSTTDPLAKIPARHGPKKILLDGPDRCIVSIV